MFSGAGCEPPYNRYRCMGLFRLTERNANQLEDGFRSHLWLK
jgi:hypothetical protein